MSKKVMIVDDSKVVRKVLINILKEASYEVISAKDGEEALSLFPGNKVDMLVTDLNMPKLNGVDLIKKVRSIPGCRFMPIIMLTTESQTEKKQEGKNAGASGWITKPFRPEQLLSVVRMVCPS